MWETVNTEEGREALSFRQDPANTALFQPHLELLAMAMHAQDQAYQ